MRMLQTSRIFSSNLTIKMCQRDAREPNKEQLKACKSEELEVILPGVSENSQSRNGGVSGAGFLTGEYAQDRRGVAGGL